MNAAEFVQRLERHGFKSRAAGAGFRAQCPGHKGADLNLAIHNGTAGGVVCQCHSHHCAIEAICAPVELTPADLCPPRPLNGGRSAGGQRVYPYRDEAGHVLFEVVREADKRFWQRLPGAAKGGIGDVRRVLFGLPELLQTQPAGLVCITEGEKCALAVAEHGLPATTNPHGAGHWRQDYTDWLQAHLPDRRFLVLPDNDMAGKTHALAVAESLQRAGLEVYLADLAKLPDKGDVVEWFHGGGTASQLDEMARPTPHALDLLVIDGHELDRRVIPTPEALVPHLLYRGFSTMIAGDSKLGKSSLLLRALLAAASGGWWLDRERRSENRLPESRILFINFEDPLFLTQDRARKMMRPDGIPQSFLTMEPPYGYRLPQILDWLHGAHERLGLDAVVLDPIAIAAEWKDETDNSEVGLTFKAIQKLAAETQLAVLSAHHVTKKPGDSGLNIRGASAIKANVLGFLMLEPEKTLFRLKGVNKLVGRWEVLLDRREEDYSWWIVESRAGSTRTPQQAQKDAAKADLYALIQAAPFVTTERLAELVPLPLSTCRRYLAEMEALGVVAALPLPRAAGQRGAPEQGWLLAPDAGQTE